MANSARQSLSSRFPGLLIEIVTFTDTKLGRGADATVYEVEWNGTVCAAKQLHEILLEDQSPGGVARLIGNFEAECLTWSKLRHPGVVQFLGMYFRHNSRLPVLVMERMDTSLRTHLEGHSKEEFPVNLKAFVFRQVIQALAYLHSQNPPLVHHDLSPNNVLLNVLSFVTKVSDFGMSRAFNPSVLSRKSSIKGTLAFMAPEALHDPPQYNEKLDVFSFGNIIITTLTHKWPNPGPPKRYEGDQVFGLTELQRRDRYVEMFTAQEKQLFLPTVTQCLQDQPSKRPSSVMLVRELRRIESSLPRGSHVTAPIELLHQQLSAKEEECRQNSEALKEKDEALREKDETLRELIEASRQKDEALRKKDEALRETANALGDKNMALKEKNEVIRVKDKALKESDEASRQKDVTLREKDATIRAQQADIQRLRDQLAVAPKVS